MRRNILSGLVSLLFVVSTTFADTYYVSLSGDDANDGKSETAAFRTIAKGASVLRAGDTLIIKSGEYGNEHVVLDSSGREDAPIVIRAEVPGEVLLKGEGDGTGLSVINKSYVVVEGIRFTNYSAGIAIKYASSYVTVRKCVFMNNHKFGLLLYGTKSDPTESHHHLFTGNQFLDYADSGPASPTSGAGIQDYGIILYFSTDVEAVNNYFYGHHHQCLSFKKIMHRSRAAHNTFEGFYYTAIYLGQNTDSAQEGNLRCKDLVAEENVFRPSVKYRAKSAIVVSNVTGAIVRNNFIDSIYGEDERSERFVPGSGIHVMPPAVGTKIYGNVLVDVKKPALMIRADCEITNNTITGCDRVLDIAEGVKAVVKNNIFYKNGKQMCVAEPLVPFREYLHYVMKDSVMVKLPVDRSKKSVFDYNLWVSDWSGKGPHGISDDPGFVGPISSLAIKAASPKFVPDFGRAKAYRLAEGSPCIDKGVDAGLPFAGPAPDLGAFEVGLFETNLEF
jgi:hypothetical protein